MGSMEKRGKEASSALGHLSCLVGPSQIRGHYMRNQSRKQGQAAGRGWVQVRAGGWVAHYTLLSILTQRQGQLALWERTDDISSKKASPQASCFFYMDRCCMAQNKLLGLPSHLCLPHS